MEFKLTKLIIYFYILKELVIDLTCYGYDIIDFNNYHYNLWEWSPHTIFVGKFEPHLTLTCPSKN